MPWRLFINKTFVAGWVFIVEDALMSRQKAVTCNPMSYETKVRLAKV